MRRITHQSQGGPTSYFRQSHREFQNKDRCLDSIRAGLDKLVIYGSGVGDVGGFKVKHKLVLTWRGAHSHPDASERTRAHWRGHCESKRKKVQHLPHWLQQE